MKKVKVAFIGCGEMANYHMSILGKIKDVEFVGMCDVDEEKAKKASSSNAGKAYTDYHKMFDDIEIDCCYICIPPFAHTGQEISCVERNIPFFVEKPVHLDLEKAKKIANKVKGRGLITSVGYQDRYQTIIEYIRPFFSRGNLGFFSGRWVGRLTKLYWLRRKELGGGQIVAESTHIFDIARYLLGEAMEVYAVKRLGLMEDVKGYNIEDASSVTINFQNGVFGTIFSGNFLKIQKGDTGLDFYFTDKIVEYTERQRVKVDYGDNT